MDVFLLLLLLLLDIYVAANHFCCRCFTFKKIVAMERDSERERERERERENACAFVAKVIFKIFINTQVLDIGEKTHNRFLTTFKSEWLVFLHAENTGSFSARVAQHFENVAAVVCGSVRAQGFHGAP